MNINNSGKIIKNDLNKLQKEEKRYKLVINLYKNKLVELGAMQKLKNKCVTKKEKLEKKKNKAIIQEETSKKESNKKENKKKEVKKQEEVKQEIQKQEAPKRRGRPRKNG